VAAIAAMAWLALTLPAVPAGGAWPGPAARARFALLGALLLWVELLALRLRRGIGTEAALTVRDG
jgi:hypothetical protein